MCARRDERVLEPCIRSRFLSLDPPPRELELRLLTQVLLFVGFAVPFQGWKLQLLG